MRLLLLFFLVGFATTSAFESLDELAENVYTGLMLQDAEEATFSKYSENDVTEEAGQRLRKMLEDLMEKIKENIEKGKEIKQDVIDKVKEVRQKLKEIKEDYGNKAKEMLKKIRERVRNKLDEMLENLGVGGKKRDVDEFDVIDPLAEIRMKDLFHRLKDFIREKVDKEKVKAKIEEIFGKGNKLADSLLDIIKKAGDKYKDKLHELIDKYLGKEKRGVKEMWEKVKNYFKDLHIDLQEKYAKFGEWVKERMGDYHEKGKTKLENIKKIANEFIDHARGIKEDVATEAIEFLRPYKEDLGALWEKVKDAYKDIRNQRSLDKEKRGVKEMWEKVKNYFKDLHIDLQEKYAKFGEWVKDRMGDYHEKGKTKLENIKKIANEFIDHARGIKEDVATEAIEFLRPYKEDLGALWEKVKDAYKDIRNQRSLDMEKRGVKEMWEKVKNYFKDLHIDLQEKYAKFGEWVKERMGDYHEKGKSKLENIKKIANEFIDHARGIKEDVATEAIEFLRPYKEDLGALWEKVKDAYKDIRNQRSLDKEKRGVKEMWEKVKNYFKDLHIDLQEKYAKFGEWVKERMGDYHEKGKTKLENIKKIANEFIDHARGIKEDVATEAIEFLRPYKEDLGALWEKVKDAYKDIRNQRSLDMEKRGVKEMWEKVKNYFKDLQIDLQEKYAKFGEWVKERMGDVHEKGKDKLENIKKIAKEVLDHARGMKEDIATEAIEFLRPYKDDLGTLWKQIKDAYKDIRNQN